MGRRKTKKIKPSKSSLALKNRHKPEREFHCHFCQHDKSVSIRIDMRSALGYLNCRICGVDFSTRITSLDEPIDVYTTWIDRCRETEKFLQSNEENKKQTQESKPSPDRLQEKVVDEALPKKPSKEDTRVESYNLEFKHTDYMNNGNFNMDTQYYEPKQIESGESSSQYDQLTLNASTLGNEDLNPEFQFIGMTRNRPSQRIIGADDLFNEFEPPRNPDSAVHNLFQDEQ